MIVGERQRGWQLSSVAAIVGAGAVARPSRVATGRWLELLPPARTAVAAGMLLVAEHVVLNSHLFDPYFLPLWSHIQGTWFSGGIVQLLVVAAAFATAMVIIPGVIGETAWPALASYFVCGALAYVIVYMLSPGYLESGYLERSVPFASFVFETAIALVIYLAWSVLRRLWRECAAWLAIASQPLRSLATAAALYVLLLVAMYWAKVQMVHVSLLPPTHFMFIQQLGKAPFRGASFAVNTYAAPVYAYTGEWAYYDSRLGDNDGGAVTSQRWVPVNRDATKYLWLADRHETRIPASRILPLLPASGSAHRRRPADHWQERRMFGRRADQIRDRSNAAVGCARGRLARSVRARQLGHRETRLEHSGYACPERRNLRDRHAHTWT